MTLWDYALLGLLVVAIGFLVFRLAVGSRFLMKYRGERLVTCPETHETVAVKVAAGRGAAKAAAGIPELRLRDCTRWPERENCGQDCLSQVEADPEGCLVWNVVNQWYADKSCTICGKPFGLINWHDHRPAVLDEKRRTVQWTDVPPEKLPEIFATHWPVCWNCHVAESFRRQHPDLITDRLKH